MAQDWYRIVQSGAGAQDLKKEASDNLEGSQAPTPSINNLSSCLDSLLAIRAVRRVVNKEVAYRDVQS